MANKMFLPTFPAKQQCSPSVRAGGAGADSVQRGCVCVCVCKGLRVPAWTAQHSTRLLGPPVPSGCLHPLSHLP